MAPHSSTLAWKVPWAEEPGGLQSTRSRRVRHDWATSLSLFTCIGEGNGNPLRCSCLENPRDGEPGGLPSMGSHRVGHDWRDLAAAAAVAACSPPILHSKSWKTNNYISQISWPLGSGCHADSGNGMHSFKFWIGTQSSCSIGDWRVASGSCDL